jgi:hypothetical protein
MMTREEALEGLREVCPAGTTVYCVLRHWRKGSSRRVIGFFTWHTNEWHPKGGPFHLNRLIAATGMYHHHKDHEGLIVEGGGMDMGFAVVYDLMHALWGADTRDERGAYKLERAWI